MPANGRLYTCWYMRSKLFQGANRRLRQQLRKTAATNYHFQVSSHKKWLQMSIMILSIHTSFIFQMKKIWNIFSNLRCCFVALLPRDGVSEGQFTQVLNIELAKIIEVNMPPIILSEPGHHILLVFLWSCASEWWWMMQACKFLRDNWYPKFMVIVAQKNHHTRFFRDGNDGSNVPAGNPEILFLV